MSYEIVNRLQEFVENEARSCSMDLAVLHLSMFIECGVERLRLRI